MNSYYPNILFKSNPLLSVGFGCGLGVSLGSVPRVNALATGVLSNPLTTHFSVKLANVTVCVGSSFLGKVVCTTVAPM